MKVVWTDEAKAHLTGIHEFIKHDAPFRVFLDSRHGQYPRLWILT